MSKEISISSPLNEDDFEKLVTRLAADYDNIALYTANPQSQSIIDDGRHLILSSAVELERLYQFRPADYRVLNLMGLYAMAQKNYSQAVYFFQKGLQQGGHDLLFIRELATLALVQNHKAEALLWLKQALALAPTEEQMVKALIVTLGQYDLSDDIESSIKTYLHAANLPKPKGDIAFLYGLHLLNNGKWEQGWRYYEERIITNEIATQTMPFARWQGQRNFAPHQSLLVFMEQGFGDIFMMLRFLTAFRQNYERRIVLVNDRPELSRFLKLLAQCNRDYHYVEWINGQLDSSMMPPIAYYDFCLSLPHRLGVTRANLPPLAPRPLIPFAETYYWQSRLGNFWSEPSKAGPLIGLALGGNPIKGKGPRLLPFSELLPYLPPNARLLNLSPSRLAYDEAMLGARILYQPAEEIRDFLDSATLINECDIVISIDNAVSHLAGIMGRPTALLLAHPCEWRWGRLLGQPQISLEGHDCLWYESVREFRQILSGDWTYPLAALSHYLRQRFRQT